jgi:tripartite-type tricarboxylate transporter receptor subunit TctC
MRETNMTLLPCLILPVAGIAMLIAVSATASLAQPNFFEGKQVRIIVVSTVGSNYDSFARLAARHLARHVPGNPTITVSNMIGASGIIAGNHVYNVAPKDGTVILSPHSSMALAQLTGVPNIEYDARQFAWIGRIASGGHDVHYTWHTTNVSRFENLLVREVIVGGTGPTSNSVILPNAVNKVLGGKLKVLRGYKGSTDTAIALERGEIEMVLQPWELLRNQHSDWLREKKVNVLVQYNAERHPELSNVPTILDVSKTDAQKQVWRLLLKPVVTGYAFGTAPGVPQDRLDTLRKAFQAMMDDQQFRLDAAKMNLAIEPDSAASLQAGVVDMFQGEPNTVATVKSLILP